MPTIPKVALLIETARSFGRDFLQGISHYSRLRGPWSFHITPGDYKQVVPKMKQWGGTGIIARITDWKMAEAILNANVPTIALGLTDEQMRPDSPLAKLSEISSDPVQVSRLAAEHLLARQLSNFAYVGSEDRAWSSRREEAFVEFVTARGYEVHVYHQPKRPQDRLWEREQEYLVRWISQLPTPIGLFACDDDRGREVLEACSVAGLHVPEDVAVVGVDNDEVFCELSNPPLSSVSLNAKSAGYQAASLLDAMMSGAVRKPQRIIVEAIDVVTRRSTEVIEVEDADIAAALQFIRREQGRDISVDDVVEEVAVSRRHLEKRFRETIGRTVLEEIQLVRLERAKRLLLETTYSVSKVASLAGFGSVGYFVQFFHKRVGKTPLKYRCTAHARRTPRI
ncbi:MAG TPA: XylR family transcriptional regulator [Lacipirellulaceae bacterium]|nr:XylR family transcriptional regulator [Lacipirellulaceae bacterium]